VPELADLRGIAVVEVLSRAENFNGGNAGLPDTLQQSDRQTVFDE
jgi:hypothetical protein